MEWQPIETAPKDGTSFDVWVKCKDCEFRGPDFIWLDGAIVHAFSDLPVARHFGNLDPVATHWMPLPPPPST